MRSESQHQAGRHLPGNLGASYLSKAGAGQVRCRRHQIGMVKSVECLHAESQIEAFTNREQLGESHVHALESLTLESISSEGAVRAEGRTRELRWRKNAAHELL